MTRIAPLTDERLLDLLLVAADAQTLEEKARVAWRANDYMWRHETAPELTGHGLPLSKCEAYNRVYDQFYQSC
jgi:hypothetical protein